MSRNIQSQQPTPPNANGILPMDAPQAEQAPTGGVFRLDTMTPGTANAHEAMAAPKKRKVSTQAIALGVLLCLGGGMIYGMRLLGIGPLTTLATTALPNYDLSRPSTQAADQQKILQDLAANHAASQVPVSEVQKNPFRISDVMGAPTTAPTGMDPKAAARYAEERAKRDAEQKMGKVKVALSSMKINGIVGGSHPVARISGEAVRVGDTIGDAPITFTVKAIHGRGVVLEREGETYELNMDDNASNSNKPKKQ